MNEAGRNLVVELSVDGIEHIHVQGQDVDAIRVTPTLQAACRGSPAARQSTLWLSNDERRVPLVLDLDAGFGHVRVELVSYQSVAALYLLHPTSQVTPLAPGAQAA